ncbi:MAG: helix-turn-helix domain-containing protein [Deltaproteobacteria bacterium]|nr:helix-turn-helix domain-containing protein [Deltaproteobacteria bacterium]
MAKPSKKGAKSEAEIAAEAQRKKEILDKVAQSNLPTKTILKELGISRSTYYSWLKRYEEDGEEGLLDSRSQAQPSEGKVEAVPPTAEAGPPPPVEDEPRDVTVERPPEPIAEEMREEEPKSPVGEEPKVKTPEPVAPPLVKKPKAEERVSRPAPTPPFSGGESKKSFGGYAFIAVLLLAIGLLVSISLSNYNTYKLVKNSNSLTLWKGKFAPRGFELVESFEPVVVGDSDVSGLTNKLYTGKAAVYKAIFAFYMDQVAGESAKGDKADMSTISLLLDRAENFMNGNGKAEEGLAAMRFNLAQERVAMAELGLQKAYQKALPIYQEALKAGLADRTTLEAKVKTMEKTLGLVPPLAPAEEAETAPPPEKIIEEPKAAAAPEEKPAEVVAAPEEEGKKGESQVVAEPAAEAGESVTTEGEREGTSEPVTEKKEETTEKPSGFKEWLKSKRSQL